MVCPMTDRICDDPECRENYCLEQADDDGEESKGAEWSVQDTE